MVAGLPVYVRRGPAEVRRALCSGPSELARGYGEDPRGYDDLTELLTALRLLEP